MRNVRFGLMAVALLTSVAAFAAGGFSPSQFCKANGDFGVSHDACVTCVNNGADDYATCECKLLQDDYYGVSLADEGFSNFGECVSTLKSYY